MKCLNCKKEKRSLRAIFEDHKTKDGRAYRKLKGYLCSDCDPERYKGKVLSSPVRKMG